MKLNAILVSTFALAGFPLFRCAMPQTAGEVKCGPRTMIYGPYRGPAIDTLWFLGCDCKQKSVDFGDLAPWRVQRDCALGGLLQSYYKVDFDLDVNGLERLAKMCRIASQAPC